MDEEKRRRLSTRIALAGLACPLGLLALILLMRADAFTFHDDFTGYKALGFFLGWAVGLLTAGLLASATAVAMNRRSVLALLAFAANFGLLGFFLLRLAY